MKMVHIAHGDTFSHKEELRSLKFMWFPPMRIWWRLWDMDSNLAVELIQLKLSNMKGVIWLDTDYDVMRNALEGRFDWLREELDTDTFYQGGNET